MQDRILLAFRKRAKKRGYKEITIKKARDAVGKHKANKSIANVPK